jgi:iron complex outermembrane receptor protein
LDQNVDFSVFDTVLKGIPVYVEIVGDPKLKAEQLLAYEAGYRTQVNQNVYLDFTAFYNRYNDLQAYGPLTLNESDSPPPLRLDLVAPYANVIKGHTLGAEIAPNWKIKPWCQVRASYSFLHMQLEDMAGFTDVGGLLSSYMGSSPSSLVGFQSLFNLPKRLEFDQTYRYSSALPAQLVGAYSTVDLRLGWHVKEKLEFSVVGQNLLRPSHQEFGGDSGPLIGIKRAVYAKMTWRR